MNMKELVELFGGKYMFGGSLIQFGEESFKEMYRQIYDAAMLTERDDCAQLCEDSVEYAGGELARQIRARTDHDQPKENT
jgi:hypothetical protein